MTPKDCWDKVKIIGNLFISAIALIVIGGYGHHINQTIKKQEIQANLVVMAVGILREEPRDGTKELRS